MRARSLTVVGLLMALAAPPAASQTEEPATLPTPSPEPVPSASAAPESSPAASPLAAPTFTTLEFARAVQAVTNLNEYNVSTAGAWVPMDPKTRLPLKLNKKKDARRAKAQARKMAAGLEKTLAGTTPDSCSLTRYAVAEDLVPVLRGYANGVAGSDMAVGLGMTSLREVGVNEFACAIAADQPDALVQAAEDGLGANDYLTRTVTSFGGKPGNERVWLTASGKELLAGALPPEGFNAKHKDRHAWRATHADFLLWMWDRAQEAGTESAISTRD